MSNRHRARRLALQGLCCLDVQGRHALEGVEHFIRDSREEPGVATDARKLLADTLEELESLDRLLARHARHWELGRLALVDRNILRLAAHELLTGQTPVKVVITEALRLAKEFSMAESPRFVNGVLDAVAREIQKDTAREDRPADDS
ncbi:MAG TPA: transcription antitermination factor NusB [Phycisphaerae bacterium]|nr:transcription antitermination factor NusB [Phycisphaerae bacterium]